MLQHVNLLPAHGLFQTGSSLTVLERENIMQHFFLAFHMQSPVPATSTASVSVIASDTLDQQIARDQMFHDMQHSTKAVLTTVPLLWVMKVHIMNLYKEKCHEY